MAEQTYSVRGMDCAHCAQELEAGIARLDGVRAVRVDFATAQMHVEGDAPFEALQRRAQALGKTLETAGRTRTLPAASSHPAGMPGFVRYLLGRRETQMALAGGALLVVTWLANLVQLVPGAGEVGYILATLVAGYPVARSGLSGLLVNRDFNINLLMTLAAAGAILIGETAEAATVIFLFAVGEALEGYTTDRARASLRGLMELAPAEATRLRAGAEERVPVESLAVDDHILVRPGERIPMDGEVVAGESGVNQAPITGESLPVHKAPGAEVYAGAINGDGALTVRVTRLAADNTLSRLIRLVEEAQSARAPSQRLIDRFARYYTPGVVAAAALVATMPPLLFGAPFANPPAGGQGWLYRALELLVIACPCSLVISTPVTIISAITAAARRGVLIKGGAHLEALGTVRTVAFDKTGTLTSGRPVVTQAHAVECMGSQPCPYCDDLLALAAAVERRSAHPLARAVVEAAQTRGLAAVYNPAEAVETLGGRGVQGTVNGQRVTIGSHELFDLEHPHGQDLCAWVAAAEADGQSTMLLCDGDRVRGFIAVADEARPESREVIAELKALGVETVMLTGDNAAVAQAVAQAVGVDAARAGLLPADKVEAVRALLANGPAAMVGDGINDTPALAAATVGIAMGGAGSDQALETADIALMADDLRQLPYTLRLARFARTLIRQNIAVSIGAKLVFMTLAVAGLGTMWLAVFADMGMSLLVTLNGMRPLRLK